jgi:small-conductance mechanosensitive channel
MMKKYITTLTILTAVLLGIKYYSDKKLDGILEVIIVYVATLTILAIITIKLQRRIKSEMAAEVLGDLIKPITVTGLLAISYVLFPGIFSYTLYDDVDIQHTIFSIVFLVVSYFIAKGIAEYMMAKDSNDKTAVIKARIVYYSILVVSIAITLRYLSLSGVLSNIILAGGITGIIVGLAAQKTMGNFIAGVILLIDKPFEIGDFIEVQNIRGYVKDITFMATIVNTFDGQVIRIPNETLLTESVSNYRKNKIIKIIQRVGVSYNSDIDLVKKAIQEALDEIEYILMDPEPFISIDEYGDNAIIFVVMYYVPFAEMFTIRRQFLEVLKRKFDKYGIEIPFPQHVHHFPEELHVSLDQ